jgi:membrane protease YdiL (CAAX protease family)
MLGRKTLLTIELVILFVLLPCVFLLSIPLVYKTLVVISGIFYVLYVSVKNKVINRKLLFYRMENKNLKNVFLRLLIFLPATVVLMFVFDPEKLFIIPRTNFLFWLMLSAFYTLFSVLPQEFLYRSFFFARYEKLVNTKFSFVVLNAVVFSWAHIGFKNELVMLLTLAGGVIFALTYLKTRSLLFTSFEHAIYGAWLFTVGAGEMLAFPMPG